MSILKRFDAFDEEIHSCRNTYENINTDNVQSKNSSDFLVKLDLFIQINTNNRYFQCYSQKNSSHTHPWGRLHRPKKKLLTRHFHQLKHACVHSKSNAPRVCRKRICSSCSLILSVGIAVAWRSVAIIKPTNRMDKIYLCCIVVDCSVIVSRRYVCVLETLIIACLYSDQVGRKKEIVFKC